MDEFIFEETTDMAEQQAPADIRFTSDKDYFLTSDTLRTDESVLEKINRENMRHDRVY